MGKFLNDLIIREIGETRHGRALFETVHELTYDVGDNGSGLHITVPAGYRFDFASVPRFFWRLFPPTGRYGKASCIHDYLTECSNFPRLIADAIFYEAMRSLGVPLIQRFLMYLAVRFYWDFCGRWINRPENRPRKFTLGEHDDKEHTEHN